MCIYKYVYTHMWSRLIFVDNKVCMHIGVYIYIYIMYYLSSRVKSLLSAPSARRLHTKICSPCTATCLRLLPYTRTGKNDRSIGLRCRSSGTLRVQP